MTLRLFFKILLLLVIVLYFAGCTKNKYKSQRKLLITKNWKLNTFVNYDDNVLYDTGETVYDFMENDILLRIIDNDTMRSKWLLNENSEYLKIDQNTYKITNLDRKTLSLRYGNFEMFFIRLK